VALAGLLAGCFAPPPSSDTGTASAAAPGTITKTAFIRQLAGICAGVNDSVKAAAKTEQARTTAVGLEDLAAKAIASGAPAEDRVKLNTFAAKLLDAANVLRALQAAQEVTNTEAAAGLKTQADAAAEDAAQAGVAYGMPHLARCKEYLASATSSAPGGGSDTSAATSTPAAGSPAPSDAPRVRAVSVGGPVGGVAVSPDGRAAYVAAIEAKQILILDVASQTVASRISLPARPRTVTVSPDGFRLYITLFAPGGNPLQSTAKGKSVVWIDLLTRRMSPVRDVGENIYGAAVAPDGSRVFCADHNSASLAVLDVTSGNVTAVHVAPNPHGVALTSDGRKGYAAAHESNAVQVIDARSLTAGRKIPVGKSPHSVAVSPDDSIVYVTNYDADTLSVIDTKTDSVVGKPIQVGANPQAVSFTPDGTRAFVVNNTSDSVSVVDTRKHRVIDTVLVGDSPTSIAVTPDGTLAYVSNFRSGTVSVISIS